MVYVKSTAKWNTNEIEQIEKEINLMQDKLKKNEKKSESISKWVNAHQKNMSKKKITEGFFSSQKKKKMWRIYFKIKKSK